MNNMTGLTRHINWRGRKLMPPHHKLKTEQLLGEIKKYKYVLRATMSKHYEI